MQFRSKDFRNGLLAATGGAALCAAALAAHAVTAGQTPRAADEKTPAAQPDVGVGAPGAAAPRTLGFVVTKFWHAMVEDPNCPDGLNKTMAEIVIDRASPAERAKLTAPGRQFALYRQSAFNAEGKSICVNPESVTTPPLSIVKGSQPVPGLDLDGRGTLTKSTATSCAHQDFADSSGKPRIDNQMFRLQGCIKGRRFGGVIHQSSTADFVNGSFSIVMEVSDVDSRVNDPDVEVAIYSSRDPTPFSAAGEPLPNGSLTVHPDHRYWARTRGRIVGGVLETDPFDVVIDIPSSGMHNEYEFRQARLQLKLKPDGTAEGVLGGYYPIDSYYRNQVSFRDGHGHFADGAADAIGFNCPSFYRALKEQADGLRDPKTGICEGISAAMMVTAVPAFVIK